MADKDHKASYAEVQVSVSMTGKDPGAKNAEAGLSVNMVNKGTNAPYATLLVISPTFFKIELARLCRGRRNVVLKST